MQVIAIAGMAVITQDPSASRQLYGNSFGLEFKTMNEYCYTDKVPGCQHFGIWPLSQAAQVCFGADRWPADWPIPQTTIEFELASPESVQAAIEEMKAKGQRCIHDARLEPWGQTTARFLSPEGVVIGLCYTPWHH